MNLFEAVKQNVTTRQAAELYGIRVNRNGMAVCPFHNDKNPSMKVDKRFHCFACQADGDAVDFVSRLFGLPSKEAAMKIADDFGIRYDTRQKTSIRPKIREPTPEQKYQQEENHCYKVLSDYFHLLRNWDILFWLEDRQLQMEEVYRFPNGMAEKNGHLCWDYQALENHILTGMKLCAEIGKIPVSVGIDTWGVDFVLLDEDDKIIGDTVGYRDHRTEGMDDVVSRMISPEELYACTGIQKAIYNTIYQLMAVKEASPEQLAKAKTFLMVPDYLHWKLCGVKANEYTEATTTQLIAPNTRDWDRELIQRLGYPTEIFQKVVQPGTVLGELTEEVANTVGFRCKVVLPATHDTASAILAMPSNNPNAVYISSGTWSLLGVELDNPDCGEESRNANFTNEGGFGEKICYLKNIMGLWMIQSVKKELAERGAEISFSELCAQAETESISSIIPCNDDRFLAPQSMIQEIQIACRETQQPIPETPGELARIVYRSLAKCYGHAIEQLRNSRKKDYRTLSILGGGSNAEYLNHLTAMETGCTVYAGPSEATAIGNALAQMICSGECQEVDHARKVVQRSFDVKILGEY